MSTSVIYTEHAHRRCFFKGGLYFTFLSANGGIKQQCAHVTTSKHLFKGSAHWQISYSPVKNNDEDKLEQHLSSHSSTPAAKTVLLAWKGIRHFSAKYSKHNTEDLAKEERERDGHRDTNRVGNLIHCKIISWTTANSGGITAVHMDSTIFKKIFFGDEEKKRRMRNERKQAGTGDCSDSFLPTESY